MVTSLIVQQEHSHIKGRVLDVGCGGKPYKRLFYDPTERIYGEGVTEWVGLDIRPVGEVTADVCAMPLEDASFDTVLCVDTLSYVFDVNAAFREMARVLKPGGTLFVVEPNTREDDSNAFWGFRMKGLGALAESVGLGIIDLKAASKLWSGEFENMRGQIKYGFTMPGEFVGFFEAMDEKYPNVSVLIARKGE